MKCACSSALITSRLGPEGLRSYNRKINLYRTHDGFVLFRNGKAIFLQALEIPQNGVLGHFESLFDGLAFGDDARESGDDSDIAARFDELPLVRARTPLFLLSYHWISSSRLPSIAAAICPPTIPR